MTKFFVFILMLLINICVNYNVSTADLIERLRKPQNNVIANDAIEDSDEYVFLITAGTHDDEANLSKHIVSIRYVPYRTKIFGGDHICGGSIIAVSLVLTAAHCVYIPKRGPMRNSDIVVVAGTPKRLKRTEHTQIRNVADIVIHRRYVSFSHRYDIALLKLDESFNLNKNYVSIIKMPHEVIRNGEECTVIGWGRMYEDLIILKQNGPAPDEILCSNITILSQVECFTRLLLFAAGNICASDREDLEKGACKGDSGGPLICNGFVTGIVSYGFGCDTHIPDVYTDVYYFRHWISQNNAYVIIKSKNHLSTALFEIVLIFFTYFIFMYYFF